MFIQYVIIIFNYINIMVVVVIIIIIQTGYALEQAMHCQNHRPSTEHCVIHFQSLQSSQKSPILVSASPRSGLGADCGHWSLLRWL